MTLNTKPETISQYCMVSSVTFKKTKAGKEYAELTLSDKTATIPACKVWDVTEEIKNTIIKYSTLNNEDIKKARNNACKISKKALWNKFIAYYDSAYDHALKKAEERN